MASWNELQTRRSSLTSTGTISSTESTDRKLDLEPPVDEHMEQIVSGMLEELMTSEKDDTDQPHVDEDSLPTHAKVIERPKRQITQTNLPTLQAPVFLPTQMILATTPLSTQQTYQQAIILPQRNPVRVGQTPLVIPTGRRGSNGQHICHLLYPTFN